MLSGDALLAGVPAPVGAVQRAAPISELAIDANSGRTPVATAPDRIRPPSSLAKMMTLLLAFETMDARRLR